MPERGCPMWYIYHPQAQHQNLNLRRQNDRALVADALKSLVLLSQRVAGLIEKNHVFGKIHFSACGGAEMGLQNRVTRGRDFRRMSRV